MYQSQVYQRGTRRNPQKMLGVPELAALVYQLTGLAAAAVREWVSDTVDVWVARDTD